MVQVREAVVMVVCVCVCVCVVGAENYECERWGGGGGIYLPGGIRVC